MHGLVAPDDLIEPYEMALGAQPADYRRKWGETVVAALVQRLGSLDGRLFEVHAGAHYVEALRPPLTAAGAPLLLPLTGLTQGQQLSWYLRGSRQTSTAPASDELDLAVAILGDVDSARSPQGFPWARRDLVTAGLYA